MSEETRTMLEQRASVYSLLASLFLRLPDEELVDSLFQGKLVEQSSSQALSEIAAFAQEKRDVPREEVLTEIAKDRVRLIRGVIQESIRPPYESLYSGAPTTETLGSLNRFYAEHACQLSEEVKDSPDQLGVEFAFMDYLTTLQIEALEKGHELQASYYAKECDHFMKQHLSRWACEYATDMKGFAQTGFYRGVAYLIEEAVE